MNDLKPEDLRIFSWASERQGSWSMSIPKGVHIIHLPTGKEVKEDSEHSQYLNRDIALEKLKGMLRGDV